MANKISKITVKDVAYNITPTAVQDIGNKQDITFKYSSGGASDPTYLAAWNGYQLTYTNRENLTVGKANNINKPSSTTGVPFSVQAFWPSTRANRLSFLSAKNILVEESTDGGKTWKDKTVSDSSKVGLFSQTRPGITLPLKNGKKSCDCMLRITVSAMNFKNVPEDGTCAQKFAAWTTTNVTSTERYCSLDGMFLWLSSNSDQIYCLVERATGVSPSVWSKDGDGFCTGWSGADYIKLSGNVFGGGTSQTGNYWFRRFTFRTATSNSQARFDDSKLSTSYQTSAQSISEITAYGVNVWNAPNNLMGTDRLYKWDTSKNVTFPADILANTISLQQHTHTFSGSQKLDWSCTPTGTLELNKYKPEGTISSTFTGTPKAPTGSFKGTEETISVSGTTAGSVTSTFTGTAKAPTGSVSASKLTSTGSYTPAGTITHLISTTTATVSKVDANYEANTQKLTISIAPPVSVIKTVTSSEPIFKGTPATISVSGTPSVSLTLNKYTPEGTVLSTFKGALMTSTGKFTPKGTITINSYTPEGTVKSTFAGTEKAPTGAFKGTTHNHTATVTISGTTGTAK